MSVRQEETQWGSWSALELVNGAMRVVLLPELGGKVVSIQSLSSGREWLWSNPRVPLRKPLEGETSYVEKFDSGGWDEIFPTITPCRVASLAWGDRELADHGELWHRPWEVTCQQVDAHAAMVLADASLPFRWKRTHSLAEGLGALTFHYEVTNQTETPLPYLWAAHPLLAIEPGMSMQLPEGTTLFCRFDSTGDRLAVDRPFVWPKAPGINGESIDLSTTPDHDAGWATKLFTSSLHEGWVALEDPQREEALHFRFDALEAPFLGLWLNYGGWSGSGGAPYFNLGIEPTTAPFDSLNDALLHDASTTLPGGESRSWSLTLSLQRSEHDA